MIDEESLRRLRDIAPVQAPPVHAIATRARSLRRRQRARRTFGGAAVMLALILGFAGSQLGAPTSRPAEVAAGDAGLGVPAPLGDPVCLGSSRRAGGAEADGLRYLFPPPPGFRLAMAFARTSTWKPDCFRWVNRLVLARLVDGVVAESVLTVGEGTLRNVEVGCDKIGPEFTECMTLGNTSARLFAPQGGDWIGVFWTRPDGVAVRITAHGVSREDVLGFASTVERTASPDDLALAGPAGFTRLWDLPGELPVPPLVDTHWVANYVANDAEHKQLSIEVMKAALPPRLATTILGPYENVVVRGRPARLGTDGKGGARSISWEEAPGVEVSISAAGGADRQLLLSAAEALQPVSADDSRVKEPK
jgi:hypothetical protein